jgi:hypothetical protein
MFERNSDIMLPQKKKILTRLIQQLQENIKQ